MASELRLPPLPNELLDARRKGEVIQFLLSLGIPTRWRFTHLGRWAQVVGVTLTALDYEQLRTLPGPEAP